MHITTVSIGSLTTRFCKSLSLYHNCKPNLRVSSSRASFISNRHSLYATSTAAQQMKRKEPLSTAQASSKRRRVEVPDYHLTPPVRDGTGIVWPAPEAQMKQARDIILDW
jgi:hypothetical protein